MKLNTIIKNSLIVFLLAASVALATPVVKTSALSAPRVNIAASLSKEAACGGLNEVDSTVEKDCSNLDDTDNGVTSIVAAIVRILSYVVGIVAVIMIVIAGFKYITSGGDSGKVGSAKNTLVYALVGVAIAALAQILVKFVLDNTAQ